MESLERTLIKLNQAFSANEIEIRNAAITRYKNAKSSKSKYISPINIKTRNHSLLKMIKKEKDEIKLFKRKFNAKKAIENLKKFPAIREVKYSKGQLNILTNDLIYNKSHNFGKYLFRFANLKNYPTRITVKRLGGSVRDDCGTCYQHPVIDNVGICFGNDRNSQLFREMMRSGKIDVAIPVLWNVLSNKARNPLINDYTFSERI